MKIIITGDKPVNPGDRILINNEDPLSLRNTVIRNAAQTNTTTVFQAEKIPASNE